MSLWCVRSQSIIEKLDGDYHHQNIGSNNIWGIIEASQKIMVVMVCLYFVFHYCFMESFSLWGWMDKSCVKIEATLAGFS